MICRGNGGNSAGFSGAVAHPTVHDAKGGQEGNRGKLETTQCDVGVPEDL